MAASLITRQPFKALYILLSTVYTGVRIPFWILYFIPSFLRQHPQWSYRQALVVRILSAVLKTVSTSEHGKSTPLHGNASKGWVVVQPARADAYTGVVSKDKLTKPVPIGGTWYPKTLQKYTGGDIVLHIHGGAFVIGDGRAGDSGFTAQSILKNSKASHTFLPQYRLSSNGARFPAALQDVITSYCYLTETLAIPEDRITISGDSAGANLSVSLLRYIADHPEAKLTSPRCAWLWSLWVDPGRSLITDPPFFSANARTDYLNDAFGTWGARHIHRAQRPGSQWLIPTSVSLAQPLRHRLPSSSPLGSVKPCRALLSRQPGNSKTYPGIRLRCT